MSSDATADKAFAARNLSQFIDVRRTFCKSLILRWIGTLNQRVGGSSPPRFTKLSRVRPGDMGYTMYLRHG